jgi:multiple sugar transport system substrate-binding protein
MSQSRFLFLLALVVVVGTAIWSEAKVRPAPRKDRVEITYWEKWSNFEADAMRAVVDDFNNSQDKIFVKFLSVSGIDQKTMLATASGIPPDLAGLFGGSVALYVHYDALTDLTDLANEAGLTKDRYIPVYHNMCTIDDRLYALPTTPASVGLHFNKKLLREKGLDPENPPKTFEDLDAMDATVATFNSKKLIEKAGFMPSEPGWWPWAWPNYFGGSLFDIESGKVTADRPENVRAYEWMASYAKRYGSQAYSDYKSGFGTFDSPQNGFLNQKVASVIQGVWMANFIDKHNKGLEWGLVPFVHPTDRPDLKNSAMVDLDIIVIPKGAKHPREAFEFLKYLQSQAAMEKLCMGQKKFSPLVVQSPAFEESHPNPYIKTFRELAMSPNVFAPPKTPIWGRYQGELGALIDDMNLGKLKPSDAMKRLQAKVSPMQEEVDRSRAARKKAVVAKVVNP